MEKILKKAIINWFDRILSKIREKRGQSVIAIFLCGILVYPLGKALLHFSETASYGYIFACIYKFDKIIDNLRLIIIWFVANAIGATVANLFFHRFIPTISEGTSMSIFSAFVILLVILKFKIKENELKKM